MRELYGDKFYKNRHQKTSSSATKVLALVSTIIPRISSVVDFGCGVGSWLAAAKNLGAAKVQGYDGPWVDLDLLQIPTECFRQADLKAPIDQESRYDLAISLEVAEHLPETSANDFVSSLCRHSDFVLFGAAIPGQGGSGHINEQWQQYWVEKFLAQGYQPMDVVRNEIWPDPEIQISYRQNTLLYVKQERLVDLKAPYCGYQSAVIDYSVVHPENFSKRVVEMKSVKGSWRHFRKNLKREIVSGVKNKR